MLTSPRFLGIAILDVFLLFGCSSGSSSRSDAAADGAGGSRSGSEGTRTGGTTGAPATGGSSVSGGGGTETGVTGGLPRDGGSAAAGGTGGGSPVDGGLRDGSSDSPRSPDGSAERSDTRVDVPLDMPGGGLGMDAGTLDASPGKDAAPVDSADASPCGICPEGLTCGVGGSPNRCGTRAPLILGKLCSPDGWCFEYPRPHGNNLTSVYATSANDIWAVGFGGTIMHFDGAAWAGVTGLFDASGTYINSIGDRLGGYNLVNFRAVWASGPTDVWIAGSTGSGDTQSGSTESPLLVRGDGTRWEVVSVPQTTAKYFSGVWGEGPDDVWVSGFSGGSAYHWNGTGWSATPVPSGAHFSGGIWGASPSEVYLPTQGGLFQWDGTTWSATTLKASLYGAWGSASAGKWAWGSSLWHLIGTTWVNMGSGGTGPLWGTSETSLWQGNRYYDGTAWRDLPGASGISAVHGPKGSGAVGVGSTGAVFDLSTTAATPVFANAAEFSGTFFDVQSRAANDVWIVGRGGKDLTAQVGRAVHWDGQAYTSYDQSAVQSFSAVGVGPDGTILLGSAKGPYSLAAGAFATSPGATDVEFKELWVAASDAAWALTGKNALIYFYDGSTWKTVPHTLSTSSVQLKDVWGIARNDVWVVGSTGMTEHWDGTAWTARTTPSATAKLVGVWAADASHVWTIAEDGTMFAWDGSQWAAAPAFKDTMGNLHGCSATELWAGTGSGGGPSLGRFDGTEWHRSITGATTFYNYGRVWCAAPGDAWLLTSSAVLRRIKAP